MGAVPDISGMTYEVGLGGLNDKAANYNASLKAITLGTEYVTQIILNLIVLIVGLWIIGKLSNLSSG
jgi:hypothetical protein